MPLFLRPLIGFIVPWFQRFVFGRVVRTAGRGALNVAPLSFHAPNLLVSLATVGAANAVNFLVLLIFRGSNVAALISTGLVVLGSAVIITHDIFNKHSLSQCINRECLTLFAALAGFYGVFAFGILVGNLWWLAFGAKLILEVILCYSLMLTKRERFEHLQHKLIFGALGILRLPIEGRIAGLLEVFKLVSPLPLTDPAVQTYQVLERRPTWFKLTNPNAVVTNQMIEAHNRNPRKVRLATKV
jgi:hypothetical protein